MNVKITSEEYADLIIDNNGIEGNIADEDKTYLNEALSMWHVPVNSIEKCSLGTYPYRYFPKCYTLQSITSLEKSGITRIQSNPNLSLMGQGVIVAVFDTGIDYQHEAFKNADGTSKILSIWDQTIQSEIPVEGVEYGTVYSRELINQALVAENPLEVVPSQDDIGHGTMIAGIIAGNESLTNNFRGVAPKSELLVVKLKQAKRITKEILAIPNESICYQETDIILATNFAIDTARRLNMPLVICIALGSSQGGHDGIGALSSYLSYLNLLNGNAIVIAAGNEGNTRRHYFGVIDSLAKHSDFELNVGENETGFLMEIWQTTPHRLSIDITSPAGEYISPIYPSINECRRISFIFESTVLYINNTLSETESGDQLIIVRFENPTPGIWKFRVSNLDNLTSYYNIWLPSGELISENTYFINSNPNTTITSPGNDISATTVTAYNHENDSIWLGASRGYTRLNMIKPDLAAPGVNLVCPLPDNKYGTTTGTGAAAAHVSGIFAMIMEWGIILKRYPDINGSEIKNLLIRGAKRDPNLVYPNNIWGYGTVDLFKTFSQIS